MAGRNWGRNGPAYGFGGGYLGPNTPAMGANMGYYVNPPMDRRPMYNASPMGKPYGSGGGFRDEHRRPHDDHRGAKRPRGRSPQGDQRRSHGRDSYQRRDNRSNRKSQYSGRYEIKVPKVPLTMKSATFQELKLMHHGISVPGDFSKACFSWQDAYPLHAPMQFANKTDIYILHRDVESQFVHEPNALDAPDADYAYSVRVMPMSTPELAELYKTSSRAADEKPESEKVAAIKNMHFIVGGRSKNETMAIGGPWSPSLDGADPDTNPQTLINTAIRTFKGFTGLDLSSVTEWIRFMEVRYYRCANSKAPTLTEDAEERNISEDKQEVVVFFVPNISHLVPSEGDWEATKQVYADVLQKLLTPPVAQDEPATNEEPSNSAVVQEQMETSQAVETSLDETQDVSHTEPVEGGPTHYSMLDVNAMKVTELRAELTARNLDSKGVKANLACRLQNALEDEKKAEEGGINQADEAPVPDSTAPAADDAPASTTEGSTQPNKEEQQPHAESKELSEKDRRRLERLYRLGDKPAILVYPNRAARGGRFDCHRVSLHSLLSNQSEELKELNFEVSLFAEQFHLMMQRDCAFTIFKAIYSAPEKDPKDVKSDQNGHEEPDVKRRRESESEQPIGAEGDDENKQRKMRRTVDPALLFAFTFFDAGHASFIRDYDMTDILHLLNLGYSKSQMKKLVAKVTSHRDHVRYRNLTDQDIVEGDDKDVVSLSLAPNDPEFVRDLAAGNDLLFGGDKPQIASKTIIASGQSDVMLKRMEAAESAKSAMEFKFFQIKDELEKTRKTLNGCKDIEDRLRKENREFQDKLKEEQRAGRDNRSLVNTYGYLLRHSRELMSNAVGEIEKQFEKEKAKREAEKAEAEKAKAEAESAAKKEEEGDDGEAKDASAEEGLKGEEKEWEVVDQV